MERAGHAAFVGGDMAESVRLLGQANHLSVEGWSELGSAYYQLGQFAESEQALQRGLEVYGRTSPFTAVWRWRSTRRGIWR